MASFGREASVGRERWTGADVVALGTVTSIAGALRLWRLNIPRSLMFDEVFYAKDACWYVFASEKLCGIGYEQTAVHPPLGKWLLAAGIRVFGFDSFGWRMAAAVAGTITVVLLFVMGRKLLGSTVGALVAAGALAVDPLHFVQSRIAMLDVFVTGFGLASFTFLLWDRDRLIENHSGGAGWGGARGPWRMAAGTAAGAALASKWSGAFVVVAAVLLSLTWAVAVRRRDGAGRPVQRALRHDGVSIVWWLILWPLLVYGATYAGRLDGALLSTPWAPGAWLRELWERQSFMYSFHSNLDATHSFQSPAWSWPLLKRPVSYFFDESASGDYREVLALGSPLAWWLSLAALGIVGWSWWRRREVGSPEGVILAGFVFLYGPWIVLAGDRSAVFLFYLLPAVPFMYLALGYAVSRLRRPLRRKQAVALLGVSFAALFAFYFPLLTALGIPYESWRTRIWVFDNCDKPPPVATEVTTTRTRAGTVVERTTTTKSNDTLPPTGWCWI